jgi:effector-binding domain-containing protein
MDYQARIEHTPARWLAVVRFHTDLADLGVKMASAFVEVMQSLSRRDIAPVGPATAYYRKQADGYSAAVGFPVPGEVPDDGPVVAISLPAAEVATVTHVGRYADLPKAYDALARRVAEQGRRLDDSGGMWEEYQTPAGTPEEQARTVVYWPVKPA